MKLKRAMRRGKNHAWCLYMTLELKLDNDIHVRKFTTHFHEQFTLVLGWSTLHTKQLYMLLSLMTLVQCLIIQNGSIPQT